MDKHKQNNETVKDANLSFFKKLVNINTSQDKLIDDLTKKLNKSDKNIGDNQKNINKNLDNISKNKSNISKNKSQADLAHENMESMFNTRFTELSGNINDNSLNISSFYDTIASQLEDVNTDILENRDLIKSLDETVTLNKETIKTNKSFADEAHENMEKIFDDKFSLINNDLATINTQLSEIVEEEM